MKFIKKIPMLSLFLVFLAFMSIEAYCQEPAKEIFISNYGKPEIHYEKIIFSTAIVIAVVIIALIALKKLRFSTLGKENLIEIVLNYPITSKDKLLVIKIASEYLLLGSSSSGLRKLHVLDSEQLDSAIAQGKIKKHEFANIFANTIGKSSNA